MINRIKINTLFKAIIAKHSDIPSLLWSWLFAFLLIISSIYISFVLKEYEHTNNFILPLDHQVSSLKDKIAQTNLSFTYVAGLYPASVYVSPQEFKQFTKPYLVGNSPIKSLGWIQKAQSLEEFSLAVDKAQLDLPHIFNFPNEKIPLSFISQDDLYPFLYQHSSVVPHLKAGLNMASVASQLPVIHKAIDSGHLAISKPVFLTEAESMPLYLAYFPIYKNGEAIDSVEQRRESLLGFVFGVIDIKALLGDFYLDGENADFILQQTNADINTSFYSSSAQTQADIAAHWQKDYWIYEQHITVADQLWTLKIKRTSRLIFLAYFLIPLCALFIGGAVIFIHLKQIRLHQAYLDKQLALEQLQQTKDVLVQSEKMAALGGLVAGVAHEINTPIGIGVTAASHLEDNISEMNKKFLAGKLNKTTFKSFIDDASEEASLILKNLTRAANLILSFKRVSVDQTSDALRSVSLQSTLTDIILSVKPQYKHTGVDIILNCPEQFIVDTYPGVIAQIITNFINNSFVHGFIDNDENGAITITVSKHEDHYLLRYEDNGNGIPKGIISKVFDPFFTTRLGQGGSGLGLHIVYNLITQSLQGGVTVGSEVGRGTWFDITLKNLEENK